jgi:hypothetical protein
LSSLWPHILGRSLLHLAAVPGICLALYLAYQYLRKHHPRAYLAVSAVGLPVLTWLAVIGAREIYDSATGQPLVKGYADLAVWGGGMLLCAAWIYYRWRDRGDQ